MTGEVEAGSGSTFAFGLADTKATSESVQARASVVAQDGSAAAQVDAWPPVTEVAAHPGTGRQVSPGRGAVHDTHAHGEQAESGSRRARRQALAPSFVVLLAVFSQPACMRPNLREYLPQPIGTSVADLDATARAWRNYCVDLQHYFDEAAMGNRTWLWIFRVATMSAAATASVFALVAADEGDNESAQSDYLLASGIVGIGTGALLSVEAFGSFDERAAQADVAADAIRNAVANFDSGFLPGNAANQLSCDDEADPEECRFRQRLAWLQYACGDAASSYHSALGSLEAGALARTGQGGGASGGSIASGQAAGGLTGVLTTTLGVRSDVPEGEEAQLGSRIAASLTACIPASYEGTGTITMPSGCTRETIKDGVEQALQEVLPNLPGASVGGIVSTVQSLFVEPEQPAGPDGGDAGTVSDGGE